MGGRGSKSKTQPNDRAPPSRRSTFQTFVVTVDPQNECVDEITSTIDGDHIELTEKTDSKDEKMTKVQKILEGKIELKKQTLAHLPATIVTLDLQFSSSEDSDDESTSTKKKRKGSKKKKKRRSTADTKARTPSHMKLKMKKETSTTKQPHDPIEHFEQIKDAYALAEYQGKEGDEARNESPHPSPQQRQTMLFHPTKQVSSPGSSPTKFFANAFDHWRRSGNSSVPSTRPQIMDPSTRSQIMDPRDHSRNSPAAKSGRSGTSMKNSSSRQRDRISSRPHSFKREGSDDDQDPFDLEEFDSSFSSSAVSNRNQSGSPEIKLTEERMPVHTTTAINASAKRNRSEKQTLRIDDTDESIMDDILAEVVT